MIISLPADITHITRDTTVQFGGLLYVNIQRVSVVVMLLTNIREVLGSNPGWDIDHPY